MPQIIQITVYNKEIQNNGNFGYIISLNYGLAQFYICVYCSFFIHYGAENENRVGENFSK